jgi:hypothetical protein
MVVRTHWLTPNHTLHSHTPHQSFNHATRNLEALTLHLPPYFAHAIDREVVHKDPHHLGLQRLVALRTGGLSCRIAALCNTLMVGRWGDRQNPADRLDPIDLPMLVNKGDHRLNGRSSSAWAKYADALRRISFA